MKYGRTIEMEAGNKSLELMKKKYKYKTNCFIGASPERLMTCNWSEDTYVEIKYPLSINYEKPNEKNLDYLY